jgi:hypothetical protein
VRQFAIDRAAQVPRRHPHADPWRRPENALTRSIVIATGIAFALLLSSRASAQDGADVAGFYAGGGITQSRFDANTFTVDHKDNSWKAIAGFRLGDSYAIEANYVDFGRARAPAVVAGGPFASEATAVSLFAVGFLPMSWGDLFLKAGAARIQADGNFTGAPIKDSVTRFAWGGGVQLRMNQVALRAEYEKYDAGVIKDLDLITIGVTYTFGGRYR